MGGWWIHMTTWTDYLESDLENIENGLKSSEATTACDQPRVKKWKVQQFKPVFKLSVFCLKNILEVIVPRERRRSAMKLNNIQNLKWNSEHFVSFRTWKFRMIVCFCVRCWLGCWKILRFEDSTFEIYRKFKKCYCINSYLSEPVFLELRRIPRVFRLNSGDFLYIYLQNVVIASIQWFTDRSQLNVALLRHKYGWDLAFEENTWSSKVYYLL